MEALAASRPGVSGKPARNVALDQARAEIARLTRTVSEQAAGLVVLEEKGGCPYVVCQAAVGSFVAGCGS